MTFFTNILTKGKKGFTLVEVLVSISIFTLAVSMGVLSVVTMNTASKKTQVRDQTMQSAYFLLDSISRSIRMGKRYTCLDANGVDLGPAGCTSTLAAGLGYIDQDGVNVWLQYRIVPATIHGVIYRNINNAGAVKLHDEYSLKLKSAGFMVNGVGFGESIQPYVTIRILVAYTYKGVEYTVPIQTTLTQRELDVAPVV